MSEYDISWCREKTALSLLEISRATLSRWRQEGTIQSRKIGGIRLYDIGTFLKQLEEGQ